jgi:hypothetical protein
MPIDFVEDYCRDAIAYMPTLSINKDVERISLRVDVLNFEGVILEADKDGERVCKKAARLAIAVPDIQPFHCGRAGDGWLDVVPDQGAHSADSKSRTKREQVSKAVDLSSAIGFDESQVATLHP